MFKSIKIILFILLGNLSLRAQIIDSFPDKNYPSIVVLGIYEFNDLVYVLPDWKDEEFEKRNEEFSVVMHKGSMDSLLSVKKKEFRYFCLKQNCYVIRDISIRNFVKDYIIPYTPEQYLPILYKTYLYRNNGTKSIDNIYGERMTYNKRYQYWEINHHKFLLVLVHVSYYNEYKSRIVPRQYRFKEDKTVQGLYLKFLIPLLEEDN